MRLKARKMLICDILSKEMEVHLSDHFTFRKIFRITIIPILMAIFASIYGVVDGICVSNFAGDDAFSGLNLIYPATFIIGGLAFMFGSGGSALVGKLLGEGKKEEANKAFSMTINFALLVGIILSVIGFFLVKPIVNAFASIRNDVTKEMVDAAIIYGRIIMIFQFTFIMQFTFQSFFVIAEKIKIGFLFTLTAGITNIVLDLLFVGLFRWGVVGAAVATTLGQFFAGAGSFIYFLKKKDRVIFLTRTKLKREPVIKICTNGLSELVTNISGSVVSLIINAQLLRYVGQDGVFAYGIIMYIQYIFIAIYFGYSTGMSPPLSYHYGAQNYKEQRNILLKSLIIVFSAGIIMMLVGFLLNKPLTYIFISRDEPELIALCEKAIRIYALCYLTMGVSIYASSFFTALNNGVVSASISLLRMLVYNLLFIFITPVLMGGVGIWWGIVFAEAAAMITSIIFIFALRKKYQYL